MIDATQILQELLALPDVLLYVMLFGSALFENLFPPLPGDAVVVFGGYLAGVGRLSLTLAFFAVTVGSWAGFMCYYLLGRWLGRTRTHDLLRRWIAPARLERGEDWVRRYGQWVVLGNRLITGARSVISLAAGFVGLPAVIVSAFALASCAAWNLLLVGAGYYIGEEWDRVLEFISAYNRIVLILLAALGIYLLYRYWRRRHTQLPSNTVKQPHP